MASPGTLVVNLLANVRPFAAGLRQASGMLGGFTKSATLQVAGLGSMFAGFAGVSAFSRLIGGAEEFNRSMRNSLAIMGDVSSAMKLQMEKAANDVAFATKFSADEAAQAYFFLASAGLDAAQSVSALPQVAKFAQAGMFDLSQATDLLTDAQSALGLTVKDAGQNLKNMTRLSDVLVKANTLANASVEQFSQALTNKAAASLRMVNKDVEEGVAVLAAFADQGLKGAEAGTAFGIVMRDLQTKAIENKAAFAQMGISVFDSTGNMNKLADIISDIENRLGSMNDEQKKATLLQLGFSDKSVAFTQVLLGMSDRIREYEAQLRLAGGTTNEVANKQLTPFQQAWEKLTAVVGQFGQEIGGPFLERTAMAIESILDLTAGLTGASSAGSAVVSFFRNIGGVLSFNLSLIAGFLAGIEAIWKRSKQLAEGVKNLLTTGSFTTTQDNSANFFKELQEQLKKQSDQFFKDAKGGGPAQQAEEMSNQIDAGANKANKLANEMQRVQGIAGGIAMDVKTAADATGNLDKRFKDAQSVAEFLRTDMDEFLEASEQLHDLYESGLISGEQMRTAIDKLDRQLFPEMFKNEPEDVVTPEAVIDDAQRRDDQLASAQELASQEAFKSVQQALQGGVGRDKVEVLTKEMLKEQKKQTGLLAKASNKGEPEKEFVIPT